MAAATVAFFVCIAAFQEARNISQYLTTTLWSRTTLSSGKPGSISYLRKMSLVICYPPLFQMFPDDWQPVWMLMKINCQHKRGPLGKICSDETQYIIPMQSRPMLNDIFPKLFHLVPFSTLTSFNLKTHLMHARLAPAYTVLTFLVFFHILRKTIF